MNAGIYVFHVTNPTLRVIGIVIMVLATFQTHKAKLLLNTSTLKIPLFHYSQDVTANWVGPSKNRKIHCITQSKSSFFESPRRIFDLTDITYANYFDGKFGSVFDRKCRNCNQIIRFVRKYLLHNLIHCILTEICSILKELD